MAIISLGQPQIQTMWTLDQPFTLVDVGQGFWGNGSFTISGNTIAAGEGHGVIRFNGPVSSLALRSANGELWSGLTFGVEGVVPEPATWAMLIAGFGLVGVALRRRRISTPLARASFRRQSVARLEHRAGRPEVGAARCASEIGLEEREARGRNEAGRVRIGPEPLPG